MSKRKQGTESKDSIVVEANGSSAQLSPSTADPIEAKRLLAYIHDDRHFSLLRNLHMADFVTMLNGFCGIMSIFNCLGYSLSRPFDETYLWKALAFLPAGLLADFFDGKVARWRGKSSLLGQELDSLADLVSFGVAPSAIAYTLGFRTPIDTLILSFFLLSGLSRLARFNVTAASLPKDASGKAKYFEGFPIPTTLALDTMMAVWVWNGWYDGKNGLPFGVIAEGKVWGVHVASLVFLLWGCAMVSKSLRVPKL